MDEESQNKEPLLIAIYADESCIGNGMEGDNPGGAAGVIEWLNQKSGKVIRWDYWISEPATTNNRMALRSVIEAFNGLSAKGNKFRVIFTTDSRYIVDGMTTWVHSWAARGWKRKGGPIGNLELWHQALAAIKGHDCEWRWVRGHEGHPQNEYANHLATRAALEQSNSGGCLASRFDEWLAEVEKNGGVIGLEGLAAQSVKNTDSAVKIKLRKIEPFPEANTFKPAKRLWTI